MSEKCPKNVRTSSKNVRITPNMRVFARYFVGSISETIRLMQEDGLDISQKTGERYLKDSRVIDLIRGKEEKERPPGVLKRQGRQKFWADIMEDENESMQYRLKASEYLAKSNMDFVEKRIVEGGDKPIKHQVQKVDLDERIKQLAGDGGIDELLQ